MKIASHRLLINNPEASLDFYQNRLGMALICKSEMPEDTRYFLSSGADQAMLELIYQPETAVSVAEQPCFTEGYWKFSLAVDDIEAVRSELIKHDIPVGDCFEVEGLAYLCHLTDPDGYCIELIQKTMKGKEPKAASSPKVSCAFNLSTLRVKNHAESIRFYSDLGMKLIYIYRAESRKMTLFFLVAEQYAQHFVSSSDAILEEKLWQSPYTLLELQQIDGTEDQDGFSYRIGPETGFLGLDLVCEAEGFAQLSEAFSEQSKTDYLELLDPDGYQLRVRELKSDFFCAR